MVSLTRQKLANLEKILNLSAEILKVTEKDKYHIERDLPALYHWLQYTKMFVYFFLNDYPKYNLMLQRAQRTLPQWQEFEI